MPLLPIPLGPSGPLGRPAPLKEACLWSGGAGLRARRVRWTNREMIPSPFLNKMASQ